MTVQFTQRVRTVEIGGKRYAIRRISDRERPRLKRLEKRGGPEFWYEVLAAAVDAPRAVIDDLDLAQVVELAKIIMREA